MGQVTISGTTVDIFGTFEAAQSYYAVSLRGTNWGAASQGDKQKALVAATRWILRVGVCGEDGQDLQPSAADTNVPVGVQEGTYELAETLLGDAAAADSATTGTNIKRAKAGSAEVEFFRPEAGSVFPTAAQRLIGPYLKSSLAQGATDGIGAASFGGGASTSVFDGDDQLGLGLNEGGYP